MTAQNFIDDKIKSQLTGLRDDDQDAKILNYLNSAKDELAKDLCMWIGGEELTLTNDTFEYTLTGAPIQITDVYNEEYTTLVRNRYESLGYFQISPKTIKLTYNPLTGAKLYVNYYETPADYASGDTIDIPPHLYSATEEFILHKAFGVIKSIKDKQASALHRANYDALVQKIIEQTDIMNSENLQTPDMITDKGLV